MSFLEVQWQAKIRSQVSDEGGYCRKWASDFQLGVPDLIVVQGGVTCFWEVKKIEISKMEDLGTRVRRANVTPKQYLELATMHKAGATAHVLLVVETSEKIARNAQEAHIGLINFDTLATDSQIHPAYVAGFLPWSGRKEWRNTVSRMLETVRA